MDRVRRGIALGPRIELNSRRRRSGHPCRATVSGFGHMTRTAELSPVQRGCSKEFGNFFSACRGILPSRSGQIKLWMSDTWQRVT